MVSRTAESSESYLEWVYVESPHWACVLVTFSNDHVTLPSDNLRRVVQDDVTVLASGDEDTRWMTLGVHPIWTPNQFVVPIKSKILVHAQQKNYTMNSMDCMRSSFNLWVEEKLPHDFMSRDESPKSSSKNSREALVLKEASSCWADVPAERKLIKYWYRDQTK